ncbi:EF-hand domain pair [Streptomyces zhaozhouensis]|uniref:EF-hand domain pair n=2 Tax=Streptomyces zhaozhouensis TaxID=1300267 RepID=A0A286E072_9ACTN|nr:EF-hand domain pair [Streptomyces zhaozhouensis]
MLMREEAVNRVRVVFSLLDADGNGVLESADFDLMADRVMAAAPRSTDEEREALRLSFRRYWTTLVSELDTDGDGRVDFQEYTACVLTPERFEPTIAAFARALTRLGDPEGQGLVARDDFMALMTAIGFAPENITALFDAFGPSPDDRIEAAVWEDEIIAYYAPDKAGIPGDRLADGVAS